MKYAEATTPELDEKKCISMYKTLTNKATLPRSCNQFEFLQEINSADVHQHTVKHRTLQRKLTGKLSGI